MPTILIVDDDKHTRALLERILLADPRVAARAPQIVTAGDGEEGLRAAGELKFDVVITDLLMPKVDGFAFCKALRERDKKVGLLVVSGVFRDATTTRRVRDELGGQLFTKPYQIKDLVAAVDKLLGSAAPSEGPAATDSVIGPSQGALEVVPLPRLLLELWEGRATGSLELRRGKIEKRIDLAVGHPVSATSNQRQETLGHFLVAKKIITEEQHQNALERARHEGGKLGESLIELGHISPAVLVKQLASQTRFKIASALRWPDGAWAYWPNRELLDRIKGNALDPAAVVFGGLKKTASVELAARTVGRHGGARLALTARGQRLRGAIGRAFGEDAAGALSSPRLVDDIIGGSLLVAVEALLLTGCAESVASGSTHRRTIPEPPDPLALDTLGDVEAELPPEPQPTRASSQNLYDELFGNEPSVVEALPAPDEPANDGVPSFALSSEDSSVIDVSIMPAPTVDADRARGHLLEEYLRVQGKDWYAVLELPRSADATEIKAAYEARLGAFSLDRYTNLDLGRDYAKLEELHAAFKHAHDVLTSEARAAYDQRLGASAPPPADPLRAELLFREGEAKLEGGDVAGAAATFREVVAFAPDVADYRAALARTLLDQPAPEAAEEAARHLALALQSDPDHAAAHELTGRAIVRAGGDLEAAAGHLERALEAQPPRLDALPVLEELRARRGEFRVLEKQYRKLIARSSGDRPLALRLWLALADVYRARLGDVESARTALQGALRLAPNDQKILDALAQLAEGDPTRFQERADALRARWRADHTNASPALELFRAATQAAHHDAAFVVAAVLDARGVLDPDADAHYRRFRPRFLVRAQQPLDANLFASIRHPDDDALLGELFELIAPAAQAYSPLALGDLEITDADGVPDDQLPAGFARVRKYVAGVLGVQPAHVFVRRDFGDQIHVGAVATPVLLVGPDSLAEDARPLELAFRLGRAMTYLWPARAVGGSRPSRVLKELLAGVMSAARMPVEDPDGKIARARAAIEALPAYARARAGQLVVELTRSRSSLNLGVWARALARTAERTGLLLCGDPRVAASAAMNLGAPTGELLDWAASDEHLAARDALGLSVAV